jgi:phage terminase large subunit-like protein
MTSLWSAAARSFAPPPERPWRQLARPSQLPPAGDWSTWLLLAGRGFGKNFAASLWLVEQAMTHAGSHWAVVSPSFAVVRDVAIEGPSGVLAAALPGEVQHYNRSLGEVRFANGSRIHGLSGDEPDRVRGLNLSGAVVDELASMRYPDDLWRGALLPAIRIPPARAVIATTPRPIGLLRDLAGRTDGSVVVTHGSTFDNRDNLSPAAMAELEERYRDTRLGEQELFGRLLTEVEGALWTPALLDTTRVERHEPGWWNSLTLGIDPASGSSTGDRQGLCVVGHSADTDQLYVLRSEGHRRQPWEFLGHCVDIATSYTPPARIILEEAGASLWGEMLAQVQRSRGTAVAVQSVKATQSKRARAEPVSGLWQQGKCHLVGAFPSSNRS